MQIECTWNGGMAFAASNGQHALAMDAKKPFGSGSQMTPKELLAAAICGCTGMDVVGLLKKHKQSAEAFSVTAHIETSSGGHPVVFSKVLLVFNLSGNLTPGVVSEAVQLSQSKFCGVSAMVAKAVPISYKVILNGEEIASGSAAFD